MPVREMLQRMGSDEITEWKAFFMLEANPNLGESVDEFIARTSGANNG